jgi:hypothetical protein
MGFSTPSARSFKTQKNLNRREMTTMRVDSRIPTAAFCHLVERYVPAFFSLCVLFILYRKKRKNDVARLHTSSIGWLLERHARKWREFIGGISGILIGVL